MPAAAPASSPAGRGGLDPKVWRVAIVVIIGAVLYFFVVIPYTAMVARSHKEPPADPTTRKCPECLSEIPKDARRCAFCGQVVAA